MSTNRDRKVAALVGGLLLIITAAVTTPPVSSQSSNFSPQNPAKEYIYAGGRLVATEEPTPPPATPTPTPTPTPSPTPTPTPTPPPPPPGSLTVENVVWTHVAGTLQVNGNSVQKMSGEYSWYDSGAVSTRTIASGDGYVDFTPAETGFYRMIGLGNGDTSYFHSDIEYAFFLADGNIYIYEAGEYRGHYGSFAASDRLRVAVEGGAVRYYRNSTLLYTSTVAPSYPLLVDTSFNTVYAGAYDVKIAASVFGGPSEPQDVVWTQASPTLQVTGNSVQKLSGEYSWYDAGAVSSRAISTGDGHVEFTPGDNGTFRMCGLGNGNDGVHHSDIEYAFFMADGNLYIYEAGEYRGHFGAFAGADRLKVAVEGGAVKYYRNSTLLYTSTVTPTYPLLVDTSFNTVYAGVYNVKMAGVLTP